CEGSALTRLVALLDLVDDVNAAAATHELVGPVARTQRLQRVADFHLSSPKVWKMGIGARRARTWRSYARFRLQDQCLRRVFLLRRVPARRPLAVDTLRLADQLAAPN